MKTDTLKAIYNEIEGKAAALSLLTYWPDQEASTPSGKHIRVRLNPVGHRQLSVCGPGSEQRYLLQLSVYLPAGSGMVLLNDIILSVKTFFTNGYQIGGIRSIRDGRLNPVIHLDGWLTQGVDFLFSKIE